MVSRIILAALSPLMLAVAACSAQQDATGPTRRALLIGCTAYPGLPKHRQLEGPGNDVPLVRDLLVKRYHFPPANIDELVEGAGEARRPTREHIRAGFEELARKSRPADRVVILMSGHGAQQPARPDDRTELDGLDEVFLPADIGSWDREHGTLINAIIDNEIGEWVGAIQAKGASVWMIFDSCHSGTMIRGTEEEVFREVPAPELVPADALAEAARAAEEAKRKGRTAIIDDRLGSKPPTSGLVALYASQDQETTVEKHLPDYSSPFHGLMTYTLCKILNEAPGPMTYAQLVRRIHDSYVTSGRSGPMPMVEGPDLRKLILEDAAPAPPAPLTLSRDGEGWAVDGGSLHGLTAGSVLAVSPTAGSIGPDGVAGHVRILARGFGPLRARVEPCEFGGKPANPRLPEGAACRPVYIEFGSLRVRVAADRYVGIEVSRGGEMPRQAIPEATRAQLSGLLRRCDATPSLPFQFADRPEGVDWLVRAADPRIEQVYLVPATGMTSGTVPSVLGPLPAEPELLGDRLRRICQFRQLLRVVGDVRERGQQAGDALNVRLELRRLKDADDTEGTPLADTSGRPDFRDGDLVGFLVSNEGRSPADVTLLFLDSSFGIEPLFPLDPGVDNRLLPGQKLLRRARINASTTGEEHMVLIAVEAERQPLRTDFTFLAQPTIERARGEGRARGTDAPRGFDSPLGELVQNALYGQGKARGLDVMQVRSYATRLVSWRTMRRGPGGE